MRPLSPATALALAYHEARRSLDPSTQNGAIIIDANGVLIGKGCNEFPRGVKVTEDRLQDRDTKLAFIEHSERNSLYDVLRNGGRTIGATMYVPWFACAACARAIIQSGITLVVGHENMFEETPERWQTSIDFAFSMFEEAGVKTELYKGKLGLEPIRFNGKMWTP